MMKLVHHVGVERALVEIARCVAQDLWRWEPIDNAPLVASHSAAGVIEPMPTSDGEVYGFECVDANLGAPLDQGTAGWDGPRRAARLRHRLGPLAPLPAS